MPTCFQPFRQIVGGFGGAKSGLTLAGQAPHDGIGHARQPVKTGLPHQFNSAVDSSMCLSFQYQQLRRAHHQNDVGIFLCAKGAARHQGGDGFFQLSPTPQAGRCQQLHKAAIPVIQIAEVDVDVHRRIELRTLGNGDENLKTDLTWGDDALLPRLAGSSCSLS